MRIRSLVSSMTALLAAAAFVIGVSAARGSAHELNHHAGALKIRVEYRLLKKKILTHDNVRVAVGRKKIVLSGTVPTLYQKDEATKLTRELARGLDVVNALNLSAPTVPDSVIDAKVMYRIRTQDPYTVFDWAVARSRKGTVTLTGWVNNQLYEGMYQRQAERVAGVKKVVNHLRFVFRYDHLARRAVRLIYHGDVLFPGVSLRFDPPIHVIAVAGSVILEGKIDSSGLAAALANRVRYRTDAIRVYDEIRSPA